LAIDQAMGTERLYASSHCAALSRVVRFRLESMGVLVPEQEEATPLIDAQPCPACAMQERYDRKALVAQQNRNARIKVPVEARAAI
jgi:hypothetical protein